MVHATLKFTVKINPVVNDMSQNKLQQFCLLFRVDKNNSFAWFKLKWKRIKVFHSVLTDLSFPRLKTDLRLWMNSEEKWPGLTSLTSSWTF